MGGDPESRCVGRVYGADGAVPCTAPSAPYTRPTQRLSGSPPIYKLDAENHKLQLNIWCSWTLRLMTNAPRYVNNQTLHTDLSIPYIKEIITTAAKKSRDHNLNHQNPLIANLYNRPLGNRRLRRYWPEDLIEWTLESHQWMEPYSGHMSA